MCVCVCVWRGGGGLAPLTPPGNAVATPLGQDLIGWSPEGLPQPEAASAPHPGAFQTLGALIKGQEGECVLPRWLLLCI